jgi:hypothetical protein
MTLQNSEKDGSNSSVLVPKVVDSMLGENNTDRAQWAADNIHSINEAVQNGRHDTLWYPASGVDVLRAAFAYDVLEAVGIDDQYTIDNLRSKLAQGGFEYDIVTDDAEKFVVKIKDGNKTRQITVLNADARLVSPQDAGMQQVDILHVYLPTGATEPIKEFDRNTGETVEIGVPVQAEISSRNLSLVKEGGFLCFGEKGLGPEPIPESLLKILGLERHSITRRHPHTVTTSFYPSEEELRSMSRMGTIYQKVSTVPAELGDLGLETLMTMFWQTYPLAEFSRGKIEFLGLTEDTITSQKISDVINEWRVYRNEAILELTKAGVNMELLVELEREMEKFVMDEFKRVQANMREFLYEFGEVSKLYQAEQINGDEALARLGVRKTKDGEYKSEKYPIAPVIAMGMGNADLIERVVGEFTELDLEKF